MVVDGFERLDLRRSQTCAFVRTRRATRQVGRRFEWTAARILDLAVGEPIHCVALRVNPLGDETNLLTQAWCRCEHSKNLRTMSIDAGQVESRRACDDAVEIV